MTTITRRFKIRGVHFLYDPKHAEPKHGHEYILEVEVDAQAGRDQLKDVVFESILTKWDKRNWSEKGLFQASGELLVEEMDRILRATQLGKHLVTVVLRETHKNRFMSSRSLRHRKHEITDDANNRR